MSRPRKELALTEQQCGTLNMRVRVGKTENRMAKRAQTMLRAAEGLLLCAAGKAVIMRRL